MPGKSTEVLVGGLVSGEGCGQKTECGWRTKGWFGGGVKEDEGQDQNSNFIEWAVRSHVRVGEEESDLRDEKITPADVDIGEKKTQWSLKEALGQLYPLVFHVLEPCEHV